MIENLSFFNTTLGANIPWDFKPNFENISKNKRLQLH